MNKLNLSVIISAVDKITVLIRNVIKGADQLTESLQANQVELDRLNQQGKLINQFKQLKFQLNDTNQELVNAREKSQSLLQKMKRSRTPTWKLRNEFGKFWQLMEHLGAK